MRTSCVAVVLLVAGQAWAEEKKPHHSAVTPAAKKDDFWVKRHHAFLDRAKKGHVDVLFLGDSITQGWEGAGKEVWKEQFDPLRAANFGIGGDRTEHVLWRITKGKELKGIHPKVFIIMIGTNNMGSNSAEEIADGITAIVHELRHQRPHAHIPLLGVFPRSQKPTDKARDKIKDVNHRVAKLDDGKHVKFLDIGDKFLTENGELTKDVMPDYLHLSPKGYKIWADAVQPELDEMLKK